MLVAGDRRLMAGVGPLQINPSCLFGCGVVFLCFTLSFKMIFGVWYIKIEDNSRRESDAMKTLCCSTFITFIQPFFLLLFRLCTFNLSLSISFVMFVSVCYARSINPYIILHKYLAGTYFFPYSFLGGLHLASAFESYSTETWPQNSSLPPFSLTLPPPLPLLPPLYRPRPSHPDSPQWVSTTPVNVTSPCVCFTLLNSPSTPTSPFP